jgi:hypothetical protein
MPSKLCRDGKKIGEQEWKDNKLGDLMLALFFAPLRSAEGRADVAKEHRGNR